MAGSDGEGDRCGSTELREEGELQHSLCRFAYLGQSLFGKNFYNISSVRSATRYYKIITYYTLETGSREKALRICNSHLLVDHVDV